MVLEERFHAVEGFWIVMKSEEGKSEDDDGCMDGG